MTDKPISPTMQKAVETMKENGGKLLRYPGGFWRTEKSHHPHYGTPTIEALVSRGVAEYTEWKEGRNGRFPVEVSLRAAE